MNYNVLVIGDSCEDEYIYGDCSRLNPEGPIPVLDKTSTEVKAGMAANVNANLKSLGIKTNLITQKETIKKTRFVDRKSNYQLLFINQTFIQSNNCNQLCNFNYIVKSISYLLSDN